MNCQTDPSYLLRSYKKKPNLLICRLEAVLLIKEVFSVTVDIYLIVTVDIYLTVTIDIYLIVT
jgi:hypothetical protein